jgi:tetratricopeptide (TPR) repeat protein
MFNKKQSSLSTLKKLTDEHLRAADKLVRLKRYQEALLEIENAYKIEPNNMYTRSFLERTRYLIEKENEKRLQMFGEIDKTSEHRMETISQLFVCIEAFIKEKKYPKALNELAKVYHLDPKNYNAQTMSERIRTLMHTETAGKTIKKPQVSVPIPSGSDALPSATPISSTHGDIPR